MTGDEMRVVVTVTGCGPCEGRCEAASGVTEHRFDHDAVSVWELDRREVSRIDRYGLRFQGHPVRKDPKHSPIFDGDTRFGSLLCRCRLR